MRSTTLRRGMIAAAIAAITATTVACGGDDDDPPAAAAQPAASAVEVVRQSFALLNNRDYGASWGLLVPSQQTVVPKDRYVDCGQQLDLLTNLRIDRVIGTHPETVTVPGSSTPVQSTAVTIQVTATDGRGAEQTFRTTQHAIPVDGGWRVALSASQLDAYRAGGCPSSD